MVSAKAGKRAQGHKKRLRRASGDGKVMGSISWGRTGVALTAPSEIWFLGRSVPVWGRAIARLRVRISYRALSNSMSVSARARMGRFSLWGS